MIRRDARTGERGATLVTIAMSLVFLLGVAGLAIDLVVLYVARSEAQRAADAAALAGATTFVTSGYTSGGVTQAVAQTLATNDAIAVGNQNLVGGQNPNIQSSDLTFNFSFPEDPRITVVVQRTAARSNAMPTFFMKIFGKTSADVSATATAEAFNPSGSPSAATYCSGCLKPFLVPNCDPVHLTPASTICIGSGVFFNSKGAIANPGRFPTGIIGESWTLHSGGAPSQWYSIALDGQQSKSAFKSNIASCNPVLHACGDTLTTLNGKSVGPATQGIDALIHAPGQDTIALNSNTSLPPFTITGGSNNPNSALVGKTIVQSDSIVTTPVYDGSTLSPGGSTVTVIGYMQMFIQSVAHNGNSDDITAIIMNTSGCANLPGTGCSAGGGGGSGTSGTISGGGASPVPVRLIQPGN